MTPVVGPETKPPVADEGERGAELFVLDDRACETWRILLKVR
jgi:hypothetical protein